MLVVIGGEKGGTGKSTLAINLAAERAVAGRDVLLVATDPQGSASHWAQVRDEAGITPHVACVQKFGKGLQTALKALARRYEDIIIDAGGRTPWNCGSAWSSWRKHISLHRPRHSRSGPLTIWTSWSPRPKRSTPPCAGSWSSPGSPPTRWSRRPRAPARSWRTMRLSPWPIRSCMTASHTGAAAAKGWPWYVSYCVRVGMK